MSISIRGKFILLIMLVTMLSFLGSQPVLANIPIGTESIVDDGDPGCKPAGPPYWMLVNQSPADGLPLGFNGNMRYMLNNKDIVENSVTWRPNILQEGDYEVFVFIPRYYGTANVLYQIITNGNCYLRWINQNKYYDEWVSLGVFHFKQGHSGYVYLDDKTGEAPLSKWIGVDAVKFVYRGGASFSYNRNASVEYSRKWTDPNLKKYGNPAFYFYSNDCANFVSQCLNAGGIPMTDSWYYSSKKNRAVSWINVMAQIDYLVRNNCSSGQTEISSASQIPGVASSGEVKPGDIVYFDYENYGDPWDHAALITTVENGEIYYTGHTTNREDYPLSAAMNNTAAKRKVGRVLILKIYN